MVDRCDTAHVSSLDPELGPGDLGGGCHEIAGCVAHGRTGSIYLARDRNVSNRWVVLKRLPNADGDGATEPALLERHFLADITHQRIATIFDVVQHGDSGYIVMEYVGAQSLKQLLVLRREANGGEPDPQTARSGDRLHPRDPARPRVPARAGPAVLRFQARQPGAPDGAFGITPQTA